MRTRLLGAINAGILILLSTTTSAALVNNGGGLIYDTALDITWAQPNTVRTWDDAKTSASGLTLGGVSGWRLPYIIVAAGAGPFTGNPSTVAQLPSLPAGTTNWVYVLPEPRRYPGPANLR